MPNRKVTRSISAKNNQVRVSPKSDWWRKVHKSWSQRDSAHTQTKSEAINTARTIARNQKGEIIIQNKDGRISNRNSYWNDPFPPRW